MRENRNMDRYGLIKELAGAYGLEGQKKGESNYDSTTGTLFVGSKVYHTSDFERAIRFFRENKKKSKSFNDASADLYEIGEIAVEMMMGASISSGGRIIVKEQ